MDRRIIIGIVVVILLLCCCAAVGIAAFAFGGLSISSSETTFDQTNITVNAPQSTGLGDDLVIEITIQNNTSDAIILDSVDVDLSYLAGISINRAEPAFTDTFSLSPVFEQQSYTFQQSIPPGSELVVEFLATATQAGEYSGAIDVCIDSGGNCRGHQVRTRVE